VLFLFDFVDVVVSSVSLIVYRLRFSHSWGLIWVIVMWGQNGCFLGW